MNGFIFCAHQTPYSDASEARVLHIAGGLTRSETFVDSTIHGNRAFVFDVSCAASTLNAWSRYGVHIPPVYVDFTSRGKNPDIRLKRPGRNRHETDQVHLLEVHDSFTYFPPSINASVHGVPLGSGCKPRTSGDSAVMWTYSRGFKVPVELRVIGTRSFAQPKVEIWIGGQQTTTRMGQWSSSEPSTQEASIDVSSVTG